jgi:hypothetical protein
MLINCDCGKLYQVTSETGQRPFNNYSASLLALQSQSESDLRQARDALIIIVYHFLLSSLNLRVTGDRPETL